MIKKTLLALAGLFVLFWVLVFATQPDKDTGSATASLPTATVVMGFDDCKAHVTSTAANLGASLVSIVDSADVYIARIPTVDGSVLITCSAADGLMAMTKSPH